MSNDDIGFALHVSLTGRHNHADLEAVRRYLDQHGWSTDTVYRIPREPKREGVGPKPEDIDALRRTAAELVGLSQRLTKEVVNVVMTTDSGAFTLRAT